MSKPFWKRHIDRMSHDDRYKALTVAIGRLIELGEIGFRSDDDVCGEDESFDEHFYWTGNGENLLNAE